MKCKKVRSKEEVNTYGRYFYRYNHGSTSRGLPAQRSETYIAAEASSPERYSANELRRLHRREVMASHVDTIATFDSKSITPFIFYKFVCPFISHPNIHGRPIVAFLSPAFETVVFHLPNPTHTLHLHFRGCLRELADPILFTVVAPTVNTASIEAILA